MKIKLIHFFFLILFLTPYSISLEPNSIYDLRINHIATPFAIDISDNNFSFKSEEDGPFKVSILKNGEVVQTKQVPLAESHSFTFDNDLEYGSLYTYVVESSSSKVELEFETSIQLSASTFIKPKNTKLFSPIFAKDFNVENKEIKKGRLYMTGLGLYQAFINDAKVGNYYLTPGFNDYDFYVRYQGYDITSLLKEKNIIEVHMGDGWYKGRYGNPRSDGKQNEIWGTEYKLCAKIIIEFSDGDIQEISTDDTWKVKSSKEIVNGIYDGEEVDYTKEYGEDEDVDISTEEYKLIPDFGSSIVQKDSLSPILYISPKGEKILDFKQNMVGFIRFKGDLQKNQELKLTFGEVLQNKNFYNGNYRTATNGLKFIGDGEKRVFEPKFTFFGFRYALVQGLDKVNPEDFEGVVIYTDLEKTIKCETDNKKINKLISNAFWGQRGNFLDVPTDCPQRDERYGWMGDAQVFSNTACFNMDSYVFYKKFIKDMREEQVAYYDGDFPMWCPSMKKKCQNGGAVWADAGAIIPWNIYMNYGDKNLLEKNYQMLIDYAEALMKKDVEQGNRRLITKGFAYGDWLALDGITEESTMGGTDNDQIMCIYYYASINIASMAAKELGKTEDFDKYDKLKDEIKEAILNEYFAPNGKLTVRTQTGYILALHYNIYRNKESLIEGFKDRLSKDTYKLKTGFTGTPLILLTLFDYGLDNDAYRFLYHQKFPGWIYAINLGATTIWERWNSLLEDGTISGTSMNSLNHYAYGSVCEAIYSRIAGLKNLSPGWKKVLIQPHLNYRMRKMNFEYNSISGKFEISWNFDEEKFFMNVTIPNGVQAEIILPDGSSEIAEKGINHYECTLNETIYTPFSIDSPLFEILENKEGNNVIRTNLPVIYYMVMGEYEEMKYGSLRLLSEQPFVGITEEVLQKVDEELKKIRVSPDEDDDPTDQQTDTSTDAPTDVHTDQSSDDPTDKTQEPVNSSFLVKFKLFIFVLIFLF